MDISPFWGAVRNQNSFDTDVLSGWFHSVIRTEFVCEVLFILIVCLQHSSVHLFCISLTVIMLCAWWTCDVLVRHACLAAHNHLQVTFLYLIAFVDVEFL